MRRSDYFYASFDCDSIEVALCLRHIQPEFTIATAMKRRGQVLVWLIGAFGVGLLWYAFTYESRRGIGSREGGPQLASTMPPVSRDLSAELRFTGTQFVVVNKDSFDWSSCGLEINGGVVRGGYKLRVTTIGARSTVTVGARQFAKSDGERFNPITMKPLSLSIACDTPLGRRFFFGQW